MSRGPRSARLSATVAAAAILVSAAVCPAVEPSLDAAPADAWPLARGCLAGTGRTAGSIRLPLAEQWQRGFDKTAFGAAPIIADGTIYIGDLDGTFHALALDTGRTRWTFKAEEAGFPSSGAVLAAAADPLVVVGDDAGLVRAFERESGKVRWTYETNGEISGGPTIVPAAADRAARVLVGSQDASLSCLALADGRLLWKHSIADQIRCSPTVARTAEGDRVFLAGCDGKLHVLDADTGDEKAAVPIGGPTGTTPAAADGRVFFGTEGGAFFAIDFLKADVAWRVQPAANPQSYRSSAAIADDLVIVGSRGKAVEAFARQDGTRKWRRPMRGRVDAAPVVVATEGGGAARAVVIVADSAGRVVALDTASGEPAWEFDAGGGFTAGAAVADGRVVIASDDGKVWCFAAPGR